MTNQDRNNQPEDRWISSSSNCQCDNPEDCWISECQQDRCWICGDSFSQNNQIRSTHTCPENMETDSECSVCTLKYLAGNGTDMSCADCDRDCCFSCALTTFSYLLNSTEQERRNSCYESLCNNCWDSDS